MMAPIQSKLSENFSWAEVELTEHRNILNKLPAEYVANVRYVANRMEVVRSLLFAPVIVNSWYRCLALNAAVGGAKNSDHLTGCAVDFVCPGHGSPLQIMKKLTRYMSMLNFKQLIYEYSWVHISFDPTIGAIAKNEVLTLLANKTYASGITDSNGNKII
jgi:Peptidase M15